MKIVLTPTPGTLLKVKLKDGTTLNNGDVDAIEVEPFFATGSENAKTLTVQGVLRDNKIVDNFFLSVSGNSGKTRRVELPRKSVTPRVELTKPTDDKPVDPKLPVGPK